MRDHIFKPASMSDTDAFELDAPTPNLAVGYTRRGVSNIFTLPARGSSAGGGYSTAPDLLRYAEAVMADRLTSAPYSAWYLGGPRPDAPPSASTPQGGGFGIAGGRPGVNAVFTLNRAQRLVLVVLTNEDEPAAEELARKIRQGRE